MSYTNRLTISKRLFGYKVNHTNHIYFKNIGLRKRQAELRTNVPAFVTRERVQVPRLPARDPQVLTGILGYRVGD